MALRCVDIIPAISGPILNALYSINSGCPTHLAQLWSKYFIQTVRAYIVPTPISSKDLKLSQPTSMIMRSCREIWDTNTTHSGTIRCWRIPKGNGSRYGLGCLQSVSVVSWHKTSSRAFKGTSSRTLTAVSHTKCPILLTSTAEIWLDSILAHTPAIIQVIRERLTGDVSL